MSEKGTGPTKTNNQIDAQLLPAYYRAVGLSEDDVAELLREPAAEADCGRIPPLIRWHDRGA
jgi:hypothetical protein